MIGHVHRRIPKRHDGVTDIFVDGAGLLVDDLAQLAKQQVEEINEFRRRQLLAQRRKAAHILEEDGERAVFTAEA